MTTWQFVAVVALVAVFAYVIINAVADLKRQIRKSETKQAHDLSRVLDLLEKVVKEK